MADTERPRLARLWRMAKRLALWSLVIVVALVLAVVILHYSQPVWELRVEGTPGTEIETCVTVYPWWMLPRQGLSAQQVPVVARYRAMRIDAYVEKQQEQGVLRVTVLRNGVVVRSGETDAPFGAPVSTPVHPARR